MDCSFSTNKLQVICPQETICAEHPYCPHGPAVLFRPSEESNDEYFACAAYRDIRQCNLHIRVKDLTASRLTKRYDMRMAIATYKGHRQKLLMAKPDGQERHYCHSCNFPLLPNELASHNDHVIAKNITSLLKDPTQLLEPLDNDKAQAQYFFDAKALQFFTNCFSRLRINKVACIGAPRMHAYLRANCNNEIDSFLLDFDYRMFYFFEDENFAWYNMCNNHFFDANQRQLFEHFLRHKDVNDRLLFLIDPPFGCRTELIAATLQALTNLYNNVNNLCHEPVAVFWVFPYFAEPYIHQQMPQLRMCDYKVNYTNHRSYTDSGNNARKLGSPVRVFTNVPLEKLYLPVAEEYKYCVPCQRYTALSNQHCVVCGTCPSKNGASYKHCERCGYCVKPNYVHCDNCRRCTQADDHNCGEYQAKQICWICMRRGHTERQCTAWLNASKRSKSIKIEEYVICCLLCGHKGHNELMCKDRSKYLDERKFMGITHVRFKKNY